MLLRAILFVLALAALPPALAASVPLDDAAFKAVSELLRKGDIPALDRYVATLKAQGAFDPNAVRGGIPLVYSANTTATLQYLEREGAKLDVPSVDEAALKMRAAAAAMVGAFGGRTGAGGTMGNLMAEAAEAANPARRANPLENRSLDRDARFYLLSKGLKPQGDALQLVIDSTPGDVQLIEAMLKAGADPAQPAASYCGPALHCLATASGAGRIALARVPEVIRLLVKYGADMNQEARNALPVHRAAMSCNADAVRLWLQAGRYDPKVVIAGQTLLDWHVLNVANCDQPRPDVIRELRRAGVDPNAGRQPPLVTLAEVRRAVPGEIFEAVIDAGARIDAGEGKGNTVLHLLVTQNLKRKAPCHQPQEKEGSCTAETAADRAALIRRLVARGADPSRPNAAGQTALDAARLLADEEKRRLYADALSAAR